jgi:hypothetical protein
VKEVDSIVGSYFVGTVIKNMLLLRMVFESKAPILLEQENPFDEYLELQYISALKNKLNDGRHFEISSE